MSASPTTSVHRIRNKLHAELATEPAVIGSAEGVGLQWLTRLRWYAAAGQVLMLWLARTWLALDVQTAPALAIAAAMFLTNVILWVRTSRAHEAAVINLVCVLDIVFLTAFLAVTGGPANPFSVFYIINVALAARVASARVTAALWLFSTIAFGSLFVAGGSHAKNLAHASHYRGMWVAYSAASALTAYFVSRVSSALQQHATRIDALRRASLAVQRLAATSTLAAGAAHELGTPLGTVAMLAEGLAHLQGASPRVHEDARTIQSEVDRCREILRDLSGANPSASDGIARVGVAAAVRNVAAKWAQVRIDVPAETTVIVPERAFSRVLSNLIKNALDAGSRHVRVHSSTSSETLRIHIEDDGCGMNATMLARLGEPYLTSKAPGEGSGLGVYLAVVFAEALGGSLDIASCEGRGTQVTLSLAVQP